MEQLVRPQESQDSIAIILSIKMILNAKGRGDDDQALMGLVLPRSKLPETPPKASGIVHIF